MATGRELSSPLRDYRNVDCEVAREALSARLDGEREPVPSARVDEHLSDCAACRDWFDHVATGAHGLRRLVRTRPASVPPLGINPALSRRSRMTWPRTALICAGVVQVGLAIVQALGLSVGLAHDHGGSAHHLLNESTSWSIALGVAMVGVALWPRAAEGLAGVLIVFVGVLTGYVIVDALSGSVTVARMLTHAPVVIGTVLTVVVWRCNAKPPPTPDEIAGDPDIVLPEHASRGRRRGHLWPTDGSAA